MASAKCNQPTYLLRLASEAYILCQSLTSKSLCSPTACFLPRATEQNAKVGNYLENIVENLAAKEYLSQPEVVLLPIPYICG